MPRDVDFATSVQRIDECIDSTGDELQERIQDDDGKVVEWVVERGDYTFTVEYPDDLDHFAVNFGYSILQTVARIISSEDAENILQAENIDVAEVDDDEQQFLAAKVLLEKTPDEIQASFGNNLIQLMSHPGVSFEFMSTDNGAIAQLTVTKNIYPFSDDFRYKEFDEAVQTVVTIGHAAMTYSHLSLDVQSVIEEETPSGPVSYIQ